MIGRDNRLSSRYRQESWRGKVGEEKLLILTKTFPKTNDVQFKMVDEIIKVEKVPKEVGKCMSSGHCIKGKRGKFPGGGILQESIQYLIAKGKI